MISKVWTVMALSWILPGSFLLGIVTNDTNIIVITPNTDTSEVAKP